MNFGALSSGTPSLTDLQFHALIDILPVGVTLAKAPSGRIIRGNRSLQAILRRPMVLAADFAGYAQAGWRDADGELLAAGDTPLARAVAGETVAGEVLQVTRGDGTRGWVRVAAAPICDERGQVMFAIATVDDIEAERQAQVKLERTVALRTAALQLSQSRARTLFEHSPLDILVLRVDGGRVTAEECNAAFCRTTGLRQPEVTGRPVELALGAQTGGAIAADCRTCLAQGGFECQHTLLFPLGKRVVRAYHRPLPDSEPDGRWVLLTQLDLTESRRVEAVLRQAMRLEAIGQLTGGVAHEFNNLLTAVLGSLDLLGQRLVDERQSRWVRNAADAARRGAMLTQQLLAYARKQFMAPDAMDIPAALDSMTELIRGSLGAGVTLGAEFLPDTWPALADPTHFQLAVLNLLANARDALPRGGRVLLATANLPAGHKELPAELEPGDYVLLSITDDGHGMAPDILARAMEPFLTTKGVGEGSGLGLSQAYGVARQLGGTVRLRSAPGLGTAAQVFLLRATPPLNPVSTQLFARR